MDDQLEIAFFGMQALATGKTAIFSLVIIIVLIAIRSRDPLQQITSWVARIRGP